MSENNSLNWLPNRGLGDFLLGVPIDNYLKKGYDLKLQEDLSASNWSTYEWCDEEVYIDVESEKIICIRSYDRFFYKGINLIGMAIEDLKSFIKIEPDKVDDPIEYENGNVQIEYSFFSLGLHVNCSFGIVVSATCITYE